MKEELKIQNEKKGRLLVNHLKKVLSKKVVSTKFESTYISTGSSTATS